MTGFWDSSSLVPACVPSQDGARAQQLLRRGRPAVWWGTAVEIVSAVDRLRRTGGISEAQAGAALARLEQLRDSWREVTPEEEVRSTAAAVIERFSLKAADALQLAAALVWSSHRPYGRTFICNDRRLAAAAEQAGFTVIAL